MLPIKNIGSALLGAGLLILSVITPAAGQATYPGGYGTGMGGMSYGMPAPMARPAYPAMTRSYGVAVSPMMSSGAAGGFVMSPRASTRYVVRSGDTLDRIAARFGITPLALLLANPRIFNANRIFVGERLVIPARFAAGFFGDGDFDADDRAVLYQVIFGDTLASIAARFHVRQATILRANPVIFNPNLIFGGQLLVIPLVSQVLVAPRVTPTPSTTPAPSMTPGPTATPAPSPQTVTVPLTAHNLSFSTTLITVPAGAQVVVDFTNQDGGVPHNFAVYTDSSAVTVIFRGQRITGPASTTYTFTAPAQPGTYFFRCDVHPTMMTGQFVVQ